MHIEIGMPVSVVGAGHLCESFLLGFQQVSNHPVAIHNRNVGRIERLRTIYESLVPRSLDQIAGSGGLVFLFVPARAVLDLDRDVIGLANASGTTFISCASGLSLNLLEAQFPETSFVKAIPNVLWCVLRGVTLVKVGHSVPSPHAHSFRKLVGSVSVLHDIGNEDDFDRVSAFTSCGPGLFAELIAQLNLGLGAISEPERKLLLQTITATGHYMLQSLKTSESIVEEVATPGGLTEVGTRALAATLPSALSFVRSRMAAKSASRRDNI
jgi:pyrroline-5-carboxylate reductase